MSKNTKEITLLFLFWGRTGGGARYAMQTAKALNEVGLSFYSSLSTGNEFFTETASYSKACCKIQTYSTKFEFLISSLLLPLKLIKLLIFIKKTKITHIYIPMRQQWTFILLFFLKHLKIKTIFTCHDPYLHSGEDSKILNLILKYEIQSCDHLITLTKSVKKTVTSDFLISKDSISVIPHASFFFDGKTKINIEKAFNDRKILLFGRLIKYKGIDIFLDACKILKNNGFEIHPSIHGQGDLTPYSDTIESLGANLQVKNQWVEDNEIVSIFLDNSLLILPYRDASQSGPLTIALGLGIPPIVTPVSGLAEQVQHLDNGMVLDCVGAESLAKAIEFIFSDFDLYQKLSIGAFKYTSKYLSWHETANSLKKSFTRA